MPLAASKAAQQLGISLRTLDRWRNEGLVTATKQHETSHWRYTLDKPTEGCVPQTERAGIIYARVSTKKQRPHLANQVKELQEKYPQHEVFTDVASGINFKRKGLLSVLELCLAGKVREVCITHKDRLCRFAYDLIEHLLTRARVQIIVDSHEDDASPESELAHDVVSIITVFGAKLYGARSGASRRKEKAQAGTTTAQARGASSHGRYRGRAKEEGPVPAQCASQRCTAVLQGQDVPDN